MYARGSGMVEMFSSHGLMIEEEEDGGNDEQRSIEQEQESVVLSAQSLPLLPLATSELGECITKMSEDFNSVMNEVCLCVCVCIYGRFQSEEDTSLYQT